MRDLSLVSLSLFLLAAGCGTAGQAPRESAGQSVARVFNLAQTLEKAQKTRKAIAAYGQIVRHYPGTPEASMAAERIRRAQKAAVLRVSARRPR